VEDFDDCAIVSVEVVKREAHTFVRLDRHPEVRRLTCYRRDRHIQDLTIDHDRERICRDDVFCLDRSKSSVEKENETSTYTRNGLALKCDADFWGSGVIHYDISSDNPRRSTPLARTNISKDRKKQSGDRDHERSRFHYPEE
jgi:hypothetical protein